MLSSHALDFPDASFATVFGTVTEMRSALKQTKAERAIVLTFQPGEQAAFDAISQGLESFTPTLNALAKDKQAAKFQKLLETLVPDVPVPEHFLLESAMRVQAQAAVLTASEWLTASQLAEAAGFSATNPSAQPNKWKQAGLIFAIHHKGSDYFPDYGLDVASGYKPLKALAEVIAVLAPAKDGWGMAFWFGATNGYLAGKAPKDLLASAPERVLAAARQELSATHG
jgi:hypothetical protein